MPRIGECTVQDGKDLFRAAYGIGADLGKRVGHAEYGSFFCWHVGTSCRSNSGAKTTGDELQGAKHGRC